MVNATVENEPIEKELITLFDISSASFSTSFDISGQDGSPQGMAWNDDGSKMYMVGNVNDSIYEYDVSTPFNISSASFSTSFDVSGQDGTLNGMAWNNDGSKMYMVGDGNNSIYEYKSLFTGNVKADNSEVWKVSIHGGNLISQNGVTITTPVEDYILSDSSQLKTVDSEPVYLNGFKIN